MLDADFPLDHGRGDACLFRDGPRQLIGAGSLGDTEADDIAADRGGEFLRSSQGNQFSAAHDADAVGACGLLHEVGGAEGRDAVFGAEFFECRPEIKTCTRIESRRGLVQEQDLGTDQEALGDLGPALESSREGLDRIVQAIGQVQGLGCFGDAGFESGTLESVEGSAAAEVFQNGQLAVETWGLEDNAESGSDFGGLRDDIMTGDGGRSGVGEREGREDPEERALASAVGSQQAEEFATADLQGDPVKGTAVPERLHQVARDDCGGVVGCTHEAGRFSAAGAVGKDSGSCSPAIASITRSESCW